MGYAVTQERGHEHEIYRFVAALLAAQYPARACLSRQFLHADLPIAALAWLWPAGTGGDLRAHQHAERVASSANPGAAGRLPARWRRHQPDHPALHAAVDARGPPGNAGLYLAQAGRCAVSRKHSPDTDLEAVRYCAWPRRSGNCAGPSRCDGGGGADAHFPVRAGGRRRDCLQLLAHAGNLVLLARPGREHPGDLPGPLPGGTLAGKHLPILAALDLDLPGACDGRDDHSCPGADWPTGMAGAPGSRLVRAACPGTLALVLALWSPALYRSVSVSRVWEDNQWRASRLPPFLI